MLSIPHDLGSRAIEHAKKHDQTLQEFILAAVRAAIYGTPVEVELRREIADLHATLRSLRGGGGGGEEYTPTPLPPPPPVKAERKGWG